MVSMGIAHGRETFFYRSVSVRIVAYYCGQKTITAFMKKQLDLSLILPCYNEHDVFEESVSFIVEALERTPWSFEIIFVDDGSSDATRKMITSICKKNPHCRFVFHKENLGRGAAVSTGILQSKAPIVGYIDIDCEVSPLYIPSFVQVIKNQEADIVIGKRIYRTNLFSIVREVLSVGYRMIVSHLLGTDRIDTESGYKFFHKKKFLPVLSSIQNTGWFWDTECVVRSLRSGLRIKEIPVLFLRRSDKKSTVRLFHDTCSYVLAIFRFLKTS